MLNTAAFAPIPRASQYRHGGESRFWRSMPRLQNAVAQSVSSAADSPFPVQLLRLW